MAKRKIKPQTNITAELQAHFNALVSGRYDSFALFSCFVNGKPAAAIVNVSDNMGSGDVIITPLFVSLTEDMVLTDHDGRAA